MSLTSQQKIALFRAYAPILYFHPDERFVPVNPAVYIQSSSLWNGQPGDDDKNHWGQKDKDLQFPRLPLIPRGGISLNASEDTVNPPMAISGVNKWFLGHYDKTRGIYPYLSSNREEELWLSMAGWQDGDDVTDISKNQGCDADRAAARWSHEAHLKSARNWYSAEVMDVDNLSRLLISIFHSNGIDVEKMLRDQFGDVWVIWYYFLYPAHQEFLRRCEQFFDKASDGNYEGDWNAVCVLIKKPAIFPWEQPNHPFPDPEYVGYGVRLRGISDQAIDDATLFRQGMNIRPWIDVEHIGQHPRIYVANGYHNNYSRAGTQNPINANIFGFEIEKLACGAVEGVDQIIDEVKNSWSDIKETAGDVGVTVAKVAAGSRIAGIWGALGGFIAGIVEALSSSADHERSPEEWKGLEEEHGPQPQHYGLILTPPEVPKPVYTDDLDSTKNDNFTSIVVWAGDDHEQLVDRDVQLWWPGSGKMPGYNGRWGVRVQKDPMQRRSGITFPDFQRAFLNDLARKLSTTPVED